MDTERAYRDIVYSEGFYDRLAAVEPQDTAAWGAFLWHVRCRVRQELGSRPRPADLSYEEAVEEYVQWTCEIVLARMKSVHRPAAFLRWLNRVIRTAMSNPDLKGLLEALSRLFEKVVDLPPERQRALHGLIQQRPPEERTLLYRALRGERLDRGDPRQRMWYRIRRELIHDPAFLRLLFALVQEGVSQAQTVLGWKDRWEAHKAYRSGAEEEDGERDGPLREPADEESLSLEEALVQQELRQALLECLETLRYKSERQYQTILRHYLYEEPLVRIKATLQAASPATPRKWHERGLKALRDCLRSKELMPERGTR